MPNWLRRWFPAWLLAAALAAAAVAAAGPGATGSELPPPAQESLPEPEPTTTTGGATPPPTAAAGQQPDQLGLPGWIDPLVTALLLALAAGTVGLLLYLGVRWLLTERVARRAFLDQPASQPAGDPASPEPVRAAVRAGLADLDAGEDPRRVVIACWLRLERAAAAAGTPRQPADTPADLVRRLLATHRVGDRPLRRLAEAYRLARYAPAEIAAELPAIARAALAEIDAQLAGDHARLAGTEPR